MNKSWNVALRDESKAQWAYSALRVADSAGRYWEKAVEKCPDYEAMCEYTREMLRLRCAKDLPVQLRSIFRHKFPE